MSPELSEASTTRRGGQVGDGSPSRCSTTWTVSRFVVARRLRKTHWRHFATLTRSGRSCEQGHQVVPFGAFARVEVSRAWCIRLAERHVEVARSGGCRRRRRDGQGHRRHRPGAPSDLVVAPSKPMRTTPRVRPGEVRHNGRQLRRAGPSYILRLRCRGNEWLEGFEKTAPNGKSVR